MGQHGPIIYFNNCRDRDYRAHYGRHGVEDCFYDLDTFEPQVSQAKNLRPGQECIVATVSKASRANLPLPSRPVRFGKYIFRAERKLRDLKGNVCRVLCGKHVGTVATHRQGVAPKRFPMFFNKNGHFLQQSTIELR